MASLESLKDPVSRLGILGTAGSQSASWRRGEVTNASDWDDTKQYYLNDMVFSGIDGGAYVMTGGPTAFGAPPVTAVKGGEDPSLAWLVDGSVWEPVAAFGPRVVVPVPVDETQTAVAAAGVITFTNCDLNQAVLGENVSFGAANYMAHIQYDVGLGATAANADFQFINFTPNGTGASARTIIAPPLTGLATGITNKWSSQLYVEVPADATEIVVSGGYSGQDPTITNLRVIYTPVVL